MIDFETMAYQNASPNDGIALICHVLFMSCAWGVLFPWGVAMAKCKHWGQWFRLHRAIQSVGCVLQLAGFMMVVWHMQFKLQTQKSHHFIGYVAVGLALAQPCNAFLRNFCSHTKPPSVGRRIFEVVHKFLGYTAIALGGVNCLIGIIWMAQGVLAIFPLALGAVSLTAFACKKSQTHLSDACDTVSGSIDETEERVIEDIKLDLRQPERSKMCPTCIGCMGLT